MKTIFQLVDLPDMPFSSSSLHLLHTAIELPKRLNNPFGYRPHPLAMSAMNEVQDYLNDMILWKDELKKGKMFGVLVVETPEGMLGYLAAFSGQLSGKSQWDGFVPAVFDYLQPDGYFKKNEELISQYNTKIDALENDAVYLNARIEFSSLQQQFKKQLAEAAVWLKEEKSRRAKLRAERLLSSAEEDSLIGESQFQKAEYRRLKHRLEAELEEKRIDLSEHEQTLTQWKETRRQLSDQLQNWLFEQFNMLNARGEHRNLLDIFAQTPQRVPPAGAGECCAPKLFQHAFLHGLKPIAIAEFWYGDSPRTTIRHHGRCYPACRGKCLPILGFMLQGLDVEKEYHEPAELLIPSIVYEDNYLMVVDKPAGLLSVPGRSERPSVYSILSNSMDEDSALWMVHRLDMGTSGLLILAKNVQVYHHLQVQFRERLVKKRYVAIVEGEVKPSEGVIELLLRPDPLDRPRQVVDMVNGKKAVTLYRVLSTKDGKTLLSLEPKTGRTHQLRMHCAHPDGLHAPIVGDELYGHPAERLFLHAASITFVHPVTGEELSFTALLPEAFKAFRCAQSLLGL